MSDLRDAEIERLNCALAISRGKHENAIREIERMDELLFNIAYNNDMDGDTMRQVVRDFLEENEDVQ